MSVVAQFLIGHFQLNTWAYVFVSPLFKTPNTGNYPFHWEDQSDLLPWETELALIISSTGWDNILNSASFRSFLVISLLVKQEVKS